MCHTTFLAYTNCVYHVTKVTICRFYINHTYHQLDNLPCPFRSKEAIQMRNDQCNCENSSTDCRMGVRGRIEWKFEGQEEIDAKWKRLRHCTSTDSLPSITLTSQDQDEEHKPIFNEEEGEPNNNSELNYVCRTSQYNDDAWTRKRKKRLKQELKDDEMEMYWLAERLSLETARQNLRKGKPGAEPQGGKDMEKDC